LLGSSRKTAGGLLSSEPRQQCLKVAHCEFHATPLAARLAVQFTARLTKVFVPRTSRKLEENRSGPISFLSPLPT